MGANEMAIPDEIPYQYQMMTFWAGLRGAVGVALAMGLQGEFKFTLLATVLVVVVLTVIIFGGTTAGMLEVLDIKTGCIDENDESDDEFDIEAPRPLSLVGMPGYSDDVPPNPDHEGQQMRADFPPLVNSANNVAGGSNAERMGSSPRLSLDRQHLRETLGTIFTADSQWFTNFDEQVLKPVFLDNSGSVSYTHLDVYKRQLQANTPTEVFLSFLLVTVSDILCSQYNGTGSHQSAQWYKRLLLTVEN